MKIWIQGFFALILAALPSISLADEIPTKNQNLVNQYWSFDSPVNTETMIEDKVYIQPDMVFLSHNQIYVNIADDLIPIQYLLCDRNGIFISIQDMQAGKGRQTWICKNPDCGHENYDGIDYCGICGLSRYAKEKKCIKYIP